MNQSPWVSEKKASEIFCVKEKTLEFWREIGYLKPGTHWRVSMDEKKSPLRTIIFYHIPWCKEVIEYWKQHDAPISDLDIAA